jgi:hypothetical protein
MISINGELGGNGYDHVLCMSRRSKGNLTLRKICVGYMFAHITHARTHTYMYIWKHLLSLFPHMELSIYKAYTTA